MCVCGAIRARAHWLHAVPGILYCYYHILIIRASSRIVFPNVRPTTSCHQFTQSAKTYAFSENRSQARVLLYTTGACSNDMCCVSHNNDVDIALYGIAAAQRPSCICIVNVPALLFRLLAKYGVGYLPQWKTERARVYCQFIIGDREMENVRAISIFGIHVPRVRGDRCWW